MKNLISKTLKTVKRLFRQYQDPSNQQEIQQLKIELSNWKKACEQKDFICRQIYHDLAAPLGLLRISTQKLGDQALAKPFALSLDRLNKLSEDLKNHKYIWSSNNAKIESLKNTFGTLAQNHKINFAIRANQKALEASPDIPTKQLEFVFLSLYEVILSSTAGESVKILARKSGNKVQLIFLHPSKDFGYKDTDIFYAKSCLQAFNGSLNCLNTSKRTALKIELPLI